MIYPWRNIAIFASLAIVSLWAVTSLPHPGDAGLHVDPLTGEVVLGASDHVERVRAIGDAHIALSRLRDVADQFPGDPQIAAAIELLVREVTDVAAPAPGDPRLDRLVDAELTRAERLRLLEELADDADVARDTETFFVPGGRVAAADLGTAGRDARALSERAGTPSLDDHLATAKGFERAARPRAQLRWLLRAHRAYPSSVVVRNELARFYLARSRLHEAFAITTDAPAAPDALELWRQRAQIARWLSRAADEAIALEHVVARREDATARQRLLDLYVHLDQGDKALRQAIHLAEHAGELAGLEQAARVALNGGRPGEALETLADLAARSADPTPWRGRIAELALQDLQVDRAVRELEASVRTGSDEQHDRQLEALYRRLDRQSELADLLERRLRRNPEDQAVWQEAIALRVALGQLARARALAGERTIAMLRPEQYRDRLDAAEVEGLTSLRERALSLHPGVEGTGIVGEVLEQLRPFLSRPGFREVAESLLARFPDDPAARSLRLELVDVGLSPLESARKAEELAAAYPDDVELARVWVDRAAWAELDDSQIRARENLFELEPEDRDNRLRLADLYEARHESQRAIPHLEELAAAEGLRSPVVPRLIDCLFAVGRNDEAVVWIRRLADDPEATVDDKLRAAEQFFYANNLDQARLFFSAVLKEAEDQPLALLRMGQILSWTNDPRGAVPYLERRLLATDERRPQVEFLLGEALWTLGERRRARAILERAAAAMRAQPDPDAETRSMIATALVRLGRADEALPLYRVMVEQAPRNLDVVLDFADVLMSRGSTEAAARMLAHARTLDPDHARVLRAGGQLDALRGDAAGARRALDRFLELYGPDAGIYADLGEVLERGDEWQSALETYRRWLSLRADDVEAGRRVHRLRDGLASAVIPSVRWAEAGDDRTLEAYLGASLATDEARTRFNVRLGHARYRGRAAAVAAGTVDVEDQIAVLDFSVVRRLDPDTRVGVGASLAPGANGDTPAGVWAGLYLQGADPYVSFEARLHLNELFDEPAAAVGLGGRSHGAQARAYVELAGPFWAGASAGVRALSVEPPGAARVEDVHLQGQLNLGYRVVEGDVAVAEGFRPRRVPAGPTSPFLAASPDVTRDVLVDAFLSLQTFHLTDGELAASIPIDDDASFVIGAVRVDKHVAHGFGATLQGFVGQEVTESTTVWGLEAAVAWRPSPLCELALGAGRGASFSRGGGDGTSRHLELQLVLRW